ncbi:16723_t:CDS:2, partial [Funneliformis caledonium]
IIFVSYSNILNVYILRQPLVIKGYSTGVPPLPELYNDCYKKLDDDGGGTILICGHSFHWHCYGADTFSKNDGFEEEPQNLEEDTEEHKNIQERDINLQNALEDIDK